MRILVALLLALALAGCGGGADAGDSKTATEIADQLGCTGDDGSDADVASCEFEGSYLGIRAFADSGERDAYVVAATNFTNVLVGEGFVIEAPDTATLNQAREIVGGEVMGCGDVAGCSAPQ